MEKCRHYQRETSTIDQQRAHRGSISLSAAFYCARESALKYAVLILQGLALYEKKI